MRSFGGKWPAKTEIGKGKSLVGDRQRVNAHTAYRHRPPTGCPCLSRKAKWERQRVPRQPAYPDHPRQEIPTPGRQASRWSSQRGRPAGTLPLSGAHPYGGLVCLLWRRVCRRVNTTQKYLRWQLAPGWGKGQIPHRELIVNSELAGDWGDLALLHSPTVRKAAA